MYFVMVNKRSMNSSEVRWLHRKHVAESERAGVAALIWHSPIRNQSLLLIRSYAKIGLLEIHIPCGRH